MILKNGKNITDRLFSIKDYEENKLEINSFFDNDLINYLISTSGNHIIKPLKELVKNNIFSFQDFKKKYGDGEILKVYKKNRFGYPKKYENYARGKAFRGKKRPEHGKKVSDKLNGIDRGDDWRKRKKEQNSSIDFKRKFLINKGYKEDLDDSYILKEYSDYISKIRLSKDYKIKKINNFLSKEKYKKYHSYNMDEEYVNNMNDEEVEEMHSAMMSIISTHAITQNNNMGKTTFFKRGILKVQYCLNRTKIHYRSSFEKDFILLLESNGLSYKYEPFFIEKNNGGLYIPDFEIVLEIEPLIFKTYIIELKGFIRGKKGKLLEIEKIKSAYNYCNNNGYEFIYYKTNKIKKDLNYILNNFKVSEPDKFIKENLKWELK